MNAEYQNRRYSVGPYNPEWPKRFAAEAEELKKIFGSDVLAIEHVGSTSVPGMSGKPTIDILIVVDDLTSADRHTAEMKRLGYEHLPEYVVSDSHLFRRMKDHVLLSNVHVFEKGNPEVQEILALRDYLRSHPEEVRAYSDFKNDLYAQYPNDYTSYRKHKDEFMEKLLQRAGVGAVS
ncbi:GrpB family protein [Patescibacteria group bacterium]|jgi:GrpB-like predicted nucleotidyltransferase (UPF0157 family)|nr:GrpB family protein [Patescibacteria group bacterium]MCL5114632.1 GrpB family protein [Patescibacteria group bacterium]